MPLCFDKLYVLVVFHCIGKVYRPVSLVFSIPAISVIFQDEGSFSMTLITLHH